MERGDQVDLPTLQINAPAETLHADSYWQRQQQTPQAALGAVTRGDNGPPPPRPQTDTDTTPHPATSSAEKSPFNDDGTTSGGESSPPRERSDGYGRTGGVTIAPPPRPRSVRDGAMNRRSDNVLWPSRRRSELDWVVPVTDDPFVPQSVAERIQSTFEAATEARKKYARQAKWNGLALNLAIALQIILGALITALSSALKPSKVGVTTSVLGGLSTLTASFLARMRGSGEPELSVTRTRDLEQFLRVLDAFKTDRGHIRDGQEDAKIEELRNRFEEILGLTNANGEQKKKSPA